MIARFLSRVSIGSPNLDKANVACIAVIEIGGSPAEVGGGDGVALRYIGNEVECGVFRVWIHEA